MEKLPEIRTRSEKAPKYDFLFKIRLDMKLSNLLQICTNFLRKFVQISTNLLVTYFYKFIRFFTKIF